MLFACVVEAEDAWDAVTVTIWVVEAVAEDPALTLFAWVVEAGDACDAL